MEGSMWSLLLYQVAYNLLGETKNDINDDKWRQVGSEEGKKEE